MHDGAQLMELLTRFGCSVALVYRLRPCSLPSRVRNPTLISVPHSFPTARTWSSVGTSHQDWAQLFAERFTVNAALRACQLPGEEFVFMPEILDGLFWKVVGYFRGVRGLAAPERAEVLHSCLSRRKNPPN